MSSRFELTGGRAVPGGCCVSSRAKPTTLSRVIPPTFEVNNCPGCSGFENTRGDASTQSDSTTNDYRAGPAGLVQAQDCPGTGSGSVGSARRFWAAAASKPPTPQTGSESTIGSTSSTDLPDIASSLASPAAEESTQAGAVHLNGFGPESLCEPWRPTLEAAWAAGLSVQRIH